MEKTIETLETQVDNLLEMLTRLAEKASEVKGLSKLADEALRFVESIEEEQY